MVLGAPRGSWTEVALRSEETVERELCQGSHLMGGSSWGVRVASHVGFVDGTHVPDGRSGVGVAICESRMFG